MCSFRNGNLANSFECYNDIQLKRAFRRFFRRHTTNRKILYCRAKTSIAANIVLLYSSQRPSKTSYEIIVIGVLSDGLHIAICTECLLKLNKINNEQEWNM